MRIVALSGGFDEFGVGVEVVVNKATIIACKCANIFDEKVLFIGFKMRL